MCTSRCGVVTTVKDGKLAGVNRDPDHPNGCICVKGAAAPEIVYSLERLRYPMLRTRPKGDADPGWVRTSWKHALDLAALRLNEIKRDDGPEAVVFSRATTAGSAAIDFDSWLQRLANAFGSPNLLTSNHICTWNRRVGSKYTYGVGMPTPDFDHTRCMLLWGVNPHATSPAQAARIARARNRGAKLIVIDPRRNALAQKADSWLRVRPGTDGILALAMIHVLLEENLYDADFVCAATNAPFLVREDLRECLTERDLDSASGSLRYLVFDKSSGRLLPGDFESGVSMEHSSLALSGRFDIRLSDGQKVICQPVLETLKDQAARFAPEISETITSVPAEEVRRAARLFASEKPSCYCTWVGLEQDAQALQTNRAICILYSLTGQFDESGSNVIFDTPPMNAVTGIHLLAKEKAALRLGINQHPLGPPADPGIVQAAEVYEAILRGRPYPVKAMVLFGSDPLLGHGDPLRGKIALQSLSFYVHVDIVANPSSQFADMMLPACTCWEREALMPSFDIAEETASWVQLRPAVIRPLYESRPDTEIIFDLAQRLGMSEQFFNGSIDEGLNFQLARCGLTAQQLRDKPGGFQLDAPKRYRKYAETDRRTGGLRGFDTPTRKIELFSITLAQAGYAALPEFNAGQGSHEKFPLTLTFFRDIHFCDEQHRNISRLRRAVPEPFLDLHPATAGACDIEEGEWIFLETTAGKIKLRARFDEWLHPEVVVTVYGWWQSCLELKLHGYDPFCPDGANANLLIANAAVDPISASVAHRGQPCRVSRS